MSHCKSFSFSFFSVLRISFQRDAFLNFRCPSSPVQSAASSTYRPPLDDEEGATAPAPAGPEPLGDVNSDHSSSSYGMVSVTATLETQARGMRNRMGV